MATWKECIVRALTAANTPLHYSDIYTKIIEAGWKRDGTATTVNVTINNDLNTPGEGSIFYRSGVGVYGLKPGGVPGHLSGDGGDDSGGGDGGDGGRAITLRDLIIQKHRTVLQEAGWEEGHSLAALCNYPLPPRNGFPEALPCRSNHKSFGSTKGVWQYHVQKRSVRVDIFFNPGTVTHYDRLVSLCNPPVVGDEHDFGDGISGNGPECGRSRSIRFSSGRGTADPDLEAAASEAVEAMKVLWRKFCSFL
jgi:hypothetical protein